MTELKDGAPCSHPGCLHHVSHPCEGCGRVAGRRKPKTTRELLDMDLRELEYHLVVKFGERFRDRIRDQLKKQEHRIRHGDPSSAKPKGVITYSPKPTKEA